ncbi:MAG TPA: class I SAM-dependent methyltransferase [Candidatus Baltobacteraceae bacterium]|nr:class I SAM-dependent methyltransferase [Candidatus Baltobacteraceae bacterium]
MNTAEIQRRMYDEVGSVRFMRRDRAFRRRLSIVHTFLQSLPPGKLLDVGCSNGEITRTFAKHELFGMDISPVSVDEACGNGINARVGDLEAEFPFDEGAFDIVFSGETIEHTIRTDFFLSQCNRMLRDGGHLVLTTPNVNSLASIIIMHMLDLPPVAAARYRSPHVRDFTKRVLGHALNQNGFEVLAVRGTFLGFPWPRVVDVIIGPIDSTVAYLAPRISAGLVVLARKTKEARYDASTEFQEALDIH